MFAIVIFVVGIVAITRRTISMNKRSLTNEVEITFAGLCAYTHTQQGTAHTHTFLNKHTHTERERDREKERNIRSLKNIYKISLKGILLKTFENTKKSTQTKNKRKKKFKQNVFKNVYISSGVRLCVYVLCEGKRSK